MFRDARFLVAPQLHSLAVLAGHATREPHVACALADLLAHLGRAASSRRLYAEVTDAKDAVPLMLFREMQARGVATDGYTCARVLAFSASYAGGSSAAVAAAVTKAVLAGRLPESSDRDRGTAAPCAPGDGGRDEEEEDAVERVGGGEHQQRPPERHGEPTV